MTAVGPIQCGTARSRAVCVVEGEFNFAVDFKNIPSTHIALVFSVAFLKFYLESISG
jgi:hypothetical protein